MAEVARTERVCVGPGAIRSPRVQTSLGIHRLGEPPQSTIAIELGSPERCQVLWRVRHGFLGLPVPSLGPHGTQKEARTPVRWNKWGRDHQADGVTPVEVPHQPRGQNL